MNSFSLTREGKELQIAMLFLAVKIYPPLTHTEPRKKTESETVLVELEAHKGLFLVTH